MLHTQDPTTVILRINTALYYKYCAFTLQRVVFLIKPQATGIAILLFLSVLLKKKSIKCLVVLLHPYLFTWGICYQVQSSAYSYGDNYISWFYHADIGYVHLLVVWMLWIPMMHKESYYNIYLASIFLDVVFIGIDYILKTQMKGFWTR